MFRDEGPGDRFHPISTGRVKGRHMQHADSCAAGQLFSLERQFGGTARSTGSRDARPCRPPAAADAWVPAR